MHARNRQRDRQKTMYGLYKCVVCIYICCCLCIYNMQREREIMRERERGKAEYSANSYAFGVEGVSIVHLRVDVCYVRQSELSTWEYHECVCVCVRESVCEPGCFCRIQDSTASAMARPFGYIVKRHSLAPAVTAGLIIASPNLTLWEGPQVHVCVR